MLANRRRLSAGCGSGPGSPVTVRATWSHLAADARESAEDDRIGLVVVRSVGAPQRRRDKAWLDEVDAVEEALDLGPRPHDQRRARAAVDVLDTLSLLGSARAALDRGVA